MFNSPVTEQLVAQALLGTSHKVLDLNVFPSDMRQNAENIMASSDTQESNFLKLAALVLSNNQTSTDVEVNSFSLEQIDLYQKALQLDLNEHKNSKAAGKGGAKRTRKSKSTTEQDLPNQVTLTTESTESSEQPLSTIDKATTKAILATVKKHKGPMPLPVCPEDNRPVFPKSVENLLCEFPHEYDEHKVVLFNVMQQLSSHNMRFSKECWQKLVTLFKGNYRILDYSFSSVMCQELLIKCGGPCFLYMLPIYLPKYKSIFFTHINGKTPVYPVFTANSLAVETNLTNNLDKAHEPTSQSVTQESQAEDRQAILAQPTAHLTVAMTNQTSTLTNQSAVMANQTASLDNHTAPLDNQIAPLDNQIAVIDWDTLFQKANHQDALGLFVKLRHENPAFARELLSRNLMRFKPDQRAEIIEAMKVNLSLDDEQFLVDIAKADRSVVSGYVALELIYNLKGTHYAQECAVLCKEHLRYQKLGQWKGTPIDPEDPKIVDLGIKAKEFGQNTVSNQCLAQLLKGMEWQDLRDLTGETDLNEVFVIWRKLNFFKSYELNILSLLARKIYLARDQEAARAFVKYATGKFHWDEDAESVLMLLDGQERINGLKACQSCDPCPDWFVEVEQKQGNSKPLDEDWLKAVAKNCLDRTRKSHSATSDRGVSLIVAAMGANSLSWLDQLSMNINARRQEIINKLNSTREKIDAMDCKAPGYAALVNTAQSLSHQSRMGLEEIYTISRFNKLLSLKLKAMQVLQKELGTQGNP